MGGGTACGQPMKGDASMGTAPRQRGMHGSGNLYDILIETFSLHSRSWHSRQVGMSKVLSHDGDSILV